MATITLMQARNFPTASHHPAKITPHAQFGQRRGGDTPYPQRNRQHWRQSHPRFANPGRIRAARMIRRGKIFNLRMIFGFRAENQDLSGEVFTRCTLRSTHLKRISPQSVHERVFLPLSTRNSVHLAKMLPDKGKFSDRSALSTHCAHFLPTTVAILAWAYCLGT